ncbi:LysE family transporter [Candidatus Bathyarchaeota archaeon]|nr:LysE family transporter [Candidatus Bathyarchaeota archaeon]
MDVVQFIMSTVIISVSGAFSPGPLTASAVAVGARKIANGGFLVALGHMLFELPYVLVIALLAIPVGAFIKNIYATYALTSFMFCFIIFFAYSNVKDGWMIIKTCRIRMPKNRMYMLNPILIGILLTALNPYFLLWWMSVGLPLVQVSVSMGFTYLLLMYMAHVWLDYLWLTIMGFAGEKSAEILKSKGYGLLLIGLGLLLAVFAADLSLRTFLNFSLLPF